MAWGSGYGFAWPVTTEGGRKLSLPGTGVLASFTSTGAETVDDIHVYVRDVVGGPILKAEVFESADLPQVATVSSYRPNEDVTTTNWTDEGGGSTNIYQSVDEASLDTSDYVTNSSTSSLYEFRVASSGHGADTVESVTIRARVQTAAAGSAFRAGFNIGGTQYDITKVGIDSTDGVVLLEFEWLENPDTGSAWVQADITAFDSSDEVVVQALDSGSKVHQIWVDVLTVSSDPVVEGMAACSADGWCDISLDSAWSKADATDYSVVFRKANSDGQVVIPALDSGAACPNASWASSLPTIDGSGVVSASGDSLTACLPVVLEVGGASSSDSQPYAALNREQVYSGRTVEQEITGSNITAGHIKTVVARHPDCEADLAVSLHDRGTDAQIGGTWTFTAAEVERSPRQLVEQNGNMASTGATTTAQNYVQWLSTADSTAPWEVAVLDALTPPVSSDADGFGGTTDAATADGTQDTDWDAPVVLQAVPAQVTGFSASAGGSDGEVDLAWTATALGGSFSHYLITRNGVPLATIATEATEELTDPGALQGTQETWGIQVVNTSDVSSLIATDTATATVGSETYIVSSLHDADLTVAVCADADSGVSYDFPEDRVVRRLMDRDYSQVLRGTVDRGDTFTVQIDPSDGTTEDRDLFDTLLALRDADVPHVTVTSWAGERWLAAVLVDTGAVQGVGTNARAQMQVIEVADRPTIAEFA